MTDQRLDIEPITRLFEGLTLSILGHDGAIAAWENYQAHKTGWTGAVPANPYDLVRKSWPTAGQPAWKITEDVAFIRCVEMPHAYGAVRNPKLEASDDPETLDQSVQYTRLWAVTWVFYGPNSYGHASDIRSAMYLSPARRTLAASNVYFVPGDGAPRRDPELFDSHWWERVDLILNYYESVIERSTVDTIGSAGFKLYTDGGVEREFTAEED